MHRYRLLILFLVIVGAGFAAKFALAPSPFPKPGEYQAEVHLPAGSEALNRLVQRYNTALRSDPEWYIGYLKEHPNVGLGEMLPYHENMGISKKDYDLAVIEMEKVRFKKFGPTVVKVINGPGGSLKIAFDAPPLKEPFELMLSADGRELSGKFGKFVDNDESAGRHSSKIIGKWKGRQWQVFSGELSTDREKDWALMDVGIGIDAEGDRILYMSGDSAKTARSMRRII
ncbi:hypothetical protein [Luteolibacter luteus]|uniref:Uncharacterized protein n=1 Tax=Luteolibacter luteus TaxID=2728835 RepID=A0A858REC1_9BACT|nr:hypothetical protein [Luteolibacter luteus]QJE94759.1 hypothetical protein HHL09_02840 [Luteolibacter luteus]